MSVLGVNRRHGEDLPIDELHAVVLAQDASLPHTMKVANREEAFYC